MKKIVLRILVLIVLIALLIFLKKYQLLSYLSLENLKLYQEELRQLYSQKQSFISVAYFLIYIITTALSLPGATILTLAGGAIFGLGFGTILVSFASSLGATSAFLLSRYIFRSSVEKRFQQKMETLNAGLAREGSWYLFTLRLIPIIPFFAINLMLGLTKFSTFKFYWISQLGMLPATLVYVNAGVELAKINTLSDIISPSLLLSFTLLGLVPLLSKKLLQFFKAQKAYAKFKKPKSFDYNIIAIGAGAGGLVTSYIAAAVKARVLLVEKNKMGGDCLNTGCVPSKALIRSAKIKALLQQSEKFGIQSSSQVNFSKVMEHIENSIKSIEPHDSVERYAKLGVECKIAEAKIISPWEVEVDGKVLSTRNIVIATGAKALVPKIPGIESICYVTNETLWQLKKLPKRFLVLGAGAIGCEMAQSFQRLGSEVYLVDRSASILSNQDQECTQYIKEQMAKDGVQLFLSSEIVRFENQNDEQYVVLQKTNGESVKISFDVCLVALGRRAKPIGTSTLDLDLNIDNTIAVNNKLQTLKYSNIYACGDVAGPFQFTHAAAHQAWYCSVNALFGKFYSFNVDYKAIPWAIFTDPEIAQVGLTEAQAKAQNLEYRVVKYDLSELDRMIVDGNNKGLVKIICAKNSDKIIGATIVASNAGDLIAEVVLAMKHGLGLNKILGTTHLYPSNAEAIKYAAGVWKQDTAPSWIYPWLEKYHRFFR